MASGIGYTKPFPQSTLVGQGAKKGLRYGVFVDLDDDRRMVVPDGLSVRRRRHDRSWSARDLVFAMVEANFNATGLRETISPDQLRGIEEHNEPIPYAVLRLLARGLDCDPVDLLAP